MYTQRCIEALHETLLNKGFLHWPDAEERRLIQHEIGCNSLFGNCVGLIDGTQIELEYIPGRDDKLLWYGRKDKYGFNIMVVCDYQHKIRYIRTAMMAACHDQKVYKAT